MSERDRLADATAWTVIVVGCCYVAVFAFLRPLFGAIEIDHEWAQTLTQVVGGFAGTLAAIGLAWWEARRRRRQDAARSIATQIESLGKLVAKLDEEISSQILALERRGQMLEGGNESIRHASRALDDGWRDLRNADFYIGRWLDVRAQMALRRVQVDSIGAGIYAYTLSSDAPDKALISLRKAEGLIEGLTDKHIPELRSALQRLL
jgi:hypothetical protein